MEEYERTAASRSVLPVILIAAVTQGWSLYTLHLAIDNKHWPATDSAWLVALYSIALLIPVTVELLAEHARKPSMALWVSVLALGLFGLGWHHGGSVLQPQENSFDNAAFPFGFELIVLWLLMLPFLQVRLASGSWRPQYQALFAIAWRNKLMLAEAALFTGALWLLLMLWQSLFHMLAIDFFRELFRKPVFIYPVTSITFGLALHLIGSVERFTAIVLEQLLNVLKWLAIVAGVILALFTAALLFKLPGLFASGQRAIGAAWLLWLVAVLVLLINAAYRDGTVDRPYPQFIAQALRFIVPLTVVISLTALYALYVRTAHYGLTVERVWAFVVTGAAVVYSIGYAFAAMRPGRWMSHITHVNVLVAVGLIATIAAALTPALSPYRLAANSLYTRVLSQPTSAHLADDVADSLSYLRFDACQYGRDRLRQLGDIKAHPRAEAIRTAALAALKQENRWVRHSAVEVDARLAKLTLYPLGRTIDEQLMRQLKVDAGSYLARPVRDEDIAGVFVDLNGDAEEEFVLLVPTQSFVYQHVASDWRSVGRMESPVQFKVPSLTEDLAHDQVRVEASDWKDLIVGGRRYRLLEPIKKTG